jgi:hypothetical protein
VTFGKIVSSGSQQYFYLLAIWNLANNGVNSIGKDNGFVDGYKYCRWFKIMEYEGKVLLLETKTTKACADFTRTFEVLGSESSTPSFNMVGDWEH